ncbi:NAD(P)-dependent oxidoreductase [Frigoribacterium sp. CFBP 8759]|uniref:NAD-dependent epimerase/dehydratase family protein n=1 Tax=Frigoribacterium sp. CFBP 8759 TaxID=2775283 RepID=UPI0017838055|nr:NAD(P)-dependent oxidoreductase [Frigoribacterium sp. CFBP 8759]
MRCEQDQDRRPIAIVGASGFIGRHVAEELESVGHVIRRLGRTATPAGTLPVDIGSRTSLGAALSGCRSAVWCVSYLGADENRQMLVNGEGPAHFARASREVGIHRVLSVSTASVYGSGPHRGAQASSMRLKPESSRSRSRLAGDSAVTAHGGVVLRPNLVFGVGDRWFLPAIATLSPESFPIAAEDARVSVTSARDLAKVVAHFATCMKQPAESSYVVAAPRPFRLREVLRAVEPLRDDARTASRSLQDLTVHQQNLLTMDNWFDVSGLWAETGLAPSEPRMVLSAAESAWYRQFLADRS